MKKNQEVLLGIVTIGLILLIFLPLPPVFNDIFITFSLILSVMTLLGTLYVKNILEFNSFPSLILFLTFFRLGLNIATTRMILTEAYAGEIIPSLGSFVTHESLLLGFVLFILLILVNFIVVTKGVSRIAEVSARFVLEAMPGKQMAIDADVNTHTLTQHEAKKERQKLASEAEFYGAMDGASKFVRGEAIASLLITVINILGGAITVLFMKKGDLATFANLIIGDGLITQIPSLLVSVATGILMTRVSKESLATLLPKQVFAHSKSFLITGLFIFILSFIPNMPILVLLPISLCLFYFSWRGEKKETKHNLLHAPISIQIKERSHALRIETTLKKVQKELKEKIGIVLEIPFAIDPDVQDSFVINIKGSSFYRSQDFEHFINSISEIILQNIHLVIQRQHVVDLLEQARETNATVVNEILSKKVPLGHIVKILQSLLKEHVFLIDFIAILEIIADYAQQGTIDCDLILEQVRMAFAKTISAPYLTNNHTLYVITLEPAIEETISQLFSTGKHLLLRPKIIENIEKYILAFHEIGKKQGIYPVVVTSMKSRHQLARVLEKHLNKFPIFSYKEIEGVSIQSIGVVPNDVLI